MSERLLSVQALSDLTGWSPFTVYRKSRNGEIPGRVKLGSSLRFRESEIDTWLKEKTATEEKAEGKGVKDYA